MRSGSISTRRPVAESPAGVPSWVQIGPFEASKIGRNGDIVDGRGHHPGRLASRRLARRPHRVWQAAGSGLVRVLKKNDAFRGGAVNE